MRSRHPLYSTWSNMKGRCYNPNRPVYKYYGGRGIKVCDRWKNSFKLFLKDMGERPEGCTLDRINNDGNYEPTNCKWSTTVEQNKNRRPCKYSHLKDEWEVQRSLGFSYREIAKVYGCSCETVWQYLNGGR